MAAGRHRARPAPSSRRRGRHRRTSDRAVRNRLLAGAVVPLVLAGGSGAYAFWSATGTGTATVDTTTTAPLSVSAAATPPPGLYPGRTVDLGFRLTNSNAYGVRLTTLTAVTVTSSAPTPCPASHITLPTAVRDGLAAGGYALPTPYDVAAGATTTQSLAGLITMATAAPDGCQGVSFTVGLSFSGSQV